MTPTATIPQTATRRPIIGYAVYLVAATLFAINGTNAKGMLDTGIPVERLSQFRVIGAFVLLLAIVAITRPRALRLSRAEIPTLLLYGIGGVAMTQYFYFIAIQYLPIGIALVIEFTAPIMVALWVRFGLRQPVRSRVWLALLLALSGLAVAAQVWQGFALSPVGVIAAFGAAAALALYYVLAEKQMRAERPRDTVSLTMWAFGAATLFWLVVQPVWTFPWDAFTGTAYPFADGGPGVPLWGMALHLVILGTVVPFWLALIAMRHITAQQASAFGMVEPVIAGAVAWVVLGQVLAPIQIVGALVVLAGILLAESSR